MELTFGLLGMCGGLLCAVGDRKNGFADNESTLFMYYVEGVVE